MTPPGDEPVVARHFWVACEGVHEDFERALVLVTGPDARLSDAISSTWSTGEGPDDRFSGRWDLVKPNGAGEAAGLVFRLRQELNAADGLERAWRLAGSGDALYDAVGRLPHLVALLPAEDDDWRPPPGEPMPSTDVALVVATEWHSDRLTDHLGERVVIDVRPWLDEALEKDLEHPENDRRMVALGDGGPPIPVVVLDVLVLRHKATQARAGWTEHVLARRADLNLEDLQRGQTILDVVAEDLCLPPHLGARWWDTFDADDEPLSDGLL